MISLYACPCSPGTVAAVSRIIACGARASDIHLPAVLQATDQLAIDEKSREYFWIGGSLPKDFVRLALPPVLWRLHAYAWLSRLSPFGRDDCKCVVLLHCQVPPCASYGTFKGGPDDGKLLCSHCSSAGRGPRPATFRWIGSGRDVNMSFNWAQVPRREPLAWFLCSPCPRSYATESERRSFDSNTCILFLNTAIWDKTQSLC